MSTDGGAVWNLVEIVGCYGNVMAIDPIDNETLYIGGNRYNGSEFVMVFGRSENQGQTWTIWDLSTEYGYTQTLAIDPLDPRIFYAGGYCADGGRLLKTENGGYDWTDITGELVGNVYALAVDPVSTVYCGTNCGIYKSLNGGLDWEQKGNFSTTAIAINPVTPNILYAGGASGVYVSETSGDDWSEMNAGLVQAPEITALSINPLRTDIVYCGSSGAGVFGVNTGLAEFVAVTIPPQGAMWWIGDNEQIQWLSAGTTGLVSIEISRNGGVTWSTIDENVNDQGTYVWTVVGPESGECVVRVSDADGTPWGTSGTFSIQALGAEDAVPQAFDLHIASANPALGTVTVSCTLPYAEDVVIAIYDMTGGLVARLHHGPLPAGTKQFHWSGNSSSGNPAASGVYLCGVVAEEQVINRPIVLLR